jgi:hypothetical protein
MENVHVKTGIALLPVVVVACCLPHGAARGDIPPPPEDERPAAAVPLVAWTVEVDPQADHARLEVPKPLLDGARRQRVGWYEQFGTVVAGLALSGAAVGLVLLRRNRRAGLALSIALATVAALAAAGVALADEAVPEDVFETPPALASGEIELVVVSRGDSVRLIVPPGWEGLGAR